MVVSHWRSRVLERRIRRSFYYSRGRAMDRLSLPLTKAVVEYFKRNAPFDDLDFQYVSDVSFAGAVSPSVLIVAMIYLERMRLTNKDYFQCSDTADMLTSALLCATKFLFDEAESEFVYNDEWALSCKRTLACVNEKEVEFLNALHWDTMANEKDFYRTLSELETFIAKNECAWRGFASYFDLLAVMTTWDAKKNIWDEILLPVLTVVSVATLTYCAAVLGLCYSSNACFHNFSTTTTTTKDIGRGIGGGGLLPSFSPSPPPVAEITLNSAFVPSSSPPLPPPIDHVAYVAPEVHSSTNDRSLMPADFEVQFHHETNHISTTRSARSRWLPLLPIRSAVNALLKNASYICDKETPEITPSSSSPPMPLPATWPVVGYFYHMVV